MNIQELLQKRAYLIDQQKALLEGALAQGRNMDPDEFAKFQNMDKEIGQIEQTVEAAQSFQKRNDNLDNNFNPAPFVPETNNQNRNEFASFGEELFAVACAGAPRGRFQGAGLVDPRLATGHSANVPSDGGFLIQPTRSSEIMKKTYEGGALLSRCATYEVGDLSDSLEIPYVDETSRADGSRWGGLRVYREGEIDNPTASKTKLGLWECRVSDAKALVYVTERLLQDAPALESYIMEALPQEFTFKIEDEIMNGTGGIQCKGIVGDPATVSVAKENGQGAATVVAQNVINMWSRCWGRSRSNAIFAINQNVEPQLFQMTLNVGTGGIPVYMPANGLSGSPYGTLFGRPVIPIEQAAGLGTVGDIVFGDFGQYAIVRKGGLKSASSVHVRFIYDEMVFKFNMRVNGKPKWKSVLTPYKGTGSTLSPFVTLATRA